MDDLDLVDRAFVVTVLSRGSGASRGVRVCLGPPRRIDYDAAGALGQDRLERLAEQRAPCPPRREGHGDGPRAGFLRLLDYPAPGLPGSHLLPVSRDPASADYARRVNDARGARLLLWGLGVD